MITNRRRLFQGGLGLSAGLIGLSAFARAADSSSLAPLKAAGLDPSLIVRHTLRHTAITQMVQAGVDLPTVQRFSGHKTLTMVARYAHQSGNHIAQAMEKLDERYKETG